ncbi:hypothetical protein [Maridesulfovibrio hydrothermalis]|uniref:Uncharacterized protein n=1 Tax=Maridesulfovibrio hydrothermalis AM13 = DSM 14728 TaxID=1121451 RepID=L0RE01_9BACT|nr:hypothetical protein [Maridesulfovibrio hydrothermalis]CCO23811.1 exported protein of unknown function [Maridesulfovibrio hydrothermalis AM13 = DSM 14728]
MSAVVRRPTVLCLVCLMFFFASVCFAAARAESSASGMLIAKGNRCYYVADQACGEVYIMYADGELNLLAGGFGHICGLAVSPDSSVYLMSSSKKRLFRIAADGKVQMVRKVDKVPDAILVDRDGVVCFVERKRDGGSNIYRVTVMK